MNDDRTWDHQTGESDESIYAREDDEQQMPSSRSTGSQSFLPTPAPTMSRSPATSSHASSFLNELAVRNSQQGNQSSLMHSLASQQSQGMLDDGMSVNGTTTTVNPNGASMGSVEMMGDSGRRTSTFGDYGNAGNGGMYAASWQTGTASSASQSPYGHQQGQSTASFVSSVPTTHTQQSFVTGAFVDSMSRSSYSSNPGQMFRPGDMPSLPLVSQHSYGYSEGRSLPALPGVSEVMDSVPRGVTGHM